MKRTKRFQDWLAMGPYGRVIGLLILILCAGLPLAGHAQTPTDTAQTDEVTVLSQTQTPAGTDTSIRINVRKDAFIASRQPDTNFGGNRELRLGWSGGSYNAMRILIEFDIAAIPRNATINKARLNIFQIGVTPGGDQPMGYRAQFMDASWDEGGVTWNNANYLGGAPLPQRVVDASIGWKQVDVTDLVNTWYSRARANHGLIVIGDETPTANRMREFSARESGQAPYITVDYTVVCDTVAPSAQVNNLPTFSVGSFVVSWRGTDAAPNGCAASGIANYDIEYRINGGGWQRWRNQTTDLSSTFRNLAANGDLVEFRARATDNAGNVQGLGSPQASTRVDSAPPQSTINPLPTITTASSFVVSWYGVDNVSGIANYDLQWRQDGGSWTALLDNTTQTSYLVTNAQNGVTYDFRLRARDNVGNQNDWPANPQASTTVATVATATILPFSPNILKPNAPVTSSFVVNWTGMAVPGLPITAYDIYYQFNGGNWKRWQTFPAGQTSATFSYQPLGLGDGAYGFEAVATNSLGQREPQNFNAEAIMLVDLADQVQPKAHLPLVAR